MSQYGMQMPGGQARRGATMNIYTGLLFVATVALGAACVFVFLQSAQVSKDPSNPFSLQDSARITLPAR
jgi:hypothetical protein